MSANRGERASPARHPRNGLRTERTGEALYRCAAHHHALTLFYCAGRGMARSRLVPTAERTGLTDAADAAVAAGVPVERGTFPVTSNSGTDPGCNGSAADAARAGSP